MNNDIESESVKAAQYAVERAIKSGCSAARSSLSISTQNSFAVRDGELDRLHGSTGSSLFIQVFINDRYGAYSTNRFDKRELESFISNAIEATKYIEKDICRGLPEKELCYRNDRPPLVQHDSRLFELSAEEMKNIAFTSADEILGSDKRLISVNCEFSGSLDFSYMTDSQGFEGASKQSLYSLSAECSVRGAGEARPEAWWYEASMFFEQLKRDGVAKMALKRATDKLSPKKMKSGRYTMVVENSVSNRLISPIISALNGASIQQNNSFLKNSLGKRLFSDKMIIFDDAINPSAMGARYFDSEGIATNPSSIIQNGRVEKYFINSYYSKKMGIPATIEGPSVPIMRPFDNIELTLKEIVYNCGNGILVTGFNGGNTNSSSGDFSFGIEGFYFENGEILHPVKEMNITGNLIELWNNLLYTGSDARDVSRWMIPSLAFEGVSFSGI